MGKYSLLVHTCQSDFLFNQLKKIYYFSLVTFLLLFGYSHLPFLLSCPVGKAEGEYVKKSNLDCSDIRSVKTQSESHKFLQISLWSESWRKIKNLYRVHSDSLPTSFHSVLLCGWRAWFVSFDPACSIGFSLLPSYDIYFKKTLWPIK